MWPDTNGGDHDWLVISMNHPAVETYITYIYFELPLGYEEYDETYFHCSIYLEVTESTFYADFYRVTQSYVVLFLKLSLVIIPHSINLGLYWSGLSFSSEIKITSNLF